MSLAPRPPLWIKICGLRSVEAIEAAVAAGVQAVGFVFHEPSPRHVAIADAAKLQATVPAGIERVAVFLHPSQELMDAVLETVRPDCVQLDAADLTSLRLPATQSVLPVVRTRGNARAAVDATTKSNVDATADTLIDVATNATIKAAGRLLVESAGSGTGAKADWAVAAHLARRTRLILAGGLDPSNIAPAIARVRPFGVDVSSGVESSRGHKSPALIEEFVQAARAAHAQLPHQSAAAGAEETDPCVPKP